MLASGVTATAGFAVLIASDIRMLRDFGFVTVIDLAVALLGVMLVLPAALVWTREAVRERRYSIVVGLLFAAVVAIAFFHTVTGNREGTLGLDKQPPRWPLPEFAVPVAASDLEGDANIAQDDCETSQVPCPADARRTPACRVAGADVIRVCDLFDRPLGDLVLVHARGGLASTSRTPSTASTSATVDG